MISKEFFEAVNQTDNASLRSEFRVVMSAVRCPQINNVRFHFPSRCLREGSCLIYALCVCLSIVVSDTYCDVFCHVCMNECKQNWTHIVTRSLVLYICFEDRCFSFCPFSFGHCVFLLRYTDSDYPFGIFKFFLIRIRKSKNRQHNDQKKKYRIDAQI
jgi:hypothetical protein